MGKSKMTALTGVATRSRSWRREWATGRGSCYEYIPHHRGHRCLGIQHQIRVSQPGAPTVEHEMFTDNQPKIAANLIEELERDGPDEGRARLTLGRTYLWVAFEGDPTGHG
jgi:hypothetical protein